MTLSASAASCQRAEHAQQLSKSNTPCSVCERGLVGGVIQHRCEQRRIRGRVHSLPDSCVRRGF